MYLHSKKAMEEGPGLDLVAEALADLLALIRAQQLAYWTIHWTVQGTAYYGDHLLFQRVYEALSEEIDALAEKIVAHISPDFVELTDQMARMQAWTDSWCLIDDPFLRAQRSEEDFQSAVRSAYDILDETGYLTLGLDDFLMAIANAHETNQYLLKQRTTAILRVARRHTLKQPLKMRPDYREAEELFTISEVE